MLASGGAVGLGHLFTRSGTAWTEQPPLEIPTAFTDRGVVSVAIAGEVATLGVPFTQNFISQRGAAYAFRRVGAAWFFQEQLVPSDFTPGTPGNASSLRLGAAVAVSGNVVLAGAPDDGSGDSGGSFRAGPGAVYVFNLSDTPPNQPPAAPTLTASAVNGAVVLSWTPASGPAATSYVLEAGTGPGLSNVFSGNVGAATQLSAVPPPGTYYVRVRGVNGFGTGPASVERSVTLGVPGTPTVTSAVESGGVLTVSWTPGAGSPASSHRLDFYSGAALVASVPSGAAASAAIPLPPGIIGQFGVRVTALAGVAASAPSDLYLFTLGASCVPPLSPSISGGVVSGTATASWAPVSGATSYIVSAGTTQGGAQYLAPTNVGAATSISASGLPPGFTAWVRVAAVNACGQQSPAADYFVQ